MTATLHFKAFADPGRANNRTSFKVETSHWGYSVRCGMPAPRLLLFVQALIWLAGCALITFALALWVLPSEITAGSAVGLKAVLTGILLATAAYCLWHSSRGVVPELQIDTSRGEVREIVRNRAGRPSVIGRYGFDAIGGVFIDRGRAFGAAGAEMSTLVLSYRNTAETLPVAQGSLADLAPLRDRLGRDLMVLGRQRNARYD